MLLSRLFPWALRSAWAVLPLVGGPAFASALDPRSVPVRSAASALLWGAWAGGTCASLVLHPVALTLLRILAPAAVAASCWATLADVGPGGFLAVAAATFAAVLFFLPETGETFVNGPAYPNERRFPLRVPTPLLLGPIALAWALTVAGPVGAVLLLASGRWSAGGILGLAAVLVTVLLGRSLHGLSRRWIVFVPAGLVIHDPMSLADPVLFPKAKIERVELASATPPDDVGLPALDLSQRAAGLGLELVVSEEAPLVLAARSGRGIGATVNADRIRFTPTRPGRVLDELRNRMGTGEGRPG